MDFPSESGPPRLCLFKSYFRVMISKFTLQIPFTIPPRFVFNDMTPEMCTGYRGHFSPPPPASHQEAILDACSSKRHSRKDVPDYSWVTVACQELFLVEHTALTKCGFFPFWFGFRFYIHLCNHSMEYIWKSEESLQESVFFFHVLQALLQSVMAGREMNCSEEVRMKIWFSLTSLGQIKLQESEVRRIITNIFKHSTIWRQVFR